MIRYTESGKGTARSHVIRIAARPASHGFSGGIGRSTSSDSATIGSAVTKNSSHCPR